MGQLSPGDTRDIADHMPLCSGYEVEARRKGGTFTVRAFCLPQSLLRVTELCFSGNA